MDEVKRLLVVGVALLLGCLPIVALEGILRHLRPPGASLQLKLPEDVPTNTTEPRALVINAAQPWLAQPGPDGTTRWSTNPQLTAGSPATMQPISFVMPRPPKTVRIFVVGGSEVYGIPVFAEPAYTYPGQLQNLLSQAFPDTPFEVLNAGVVGQSTREMLGVVQRVAEFQPQVIVFTGGGVDLRTWVDILISSNPQLFALQEKASSLATFQLLRDLYHRIRPLPPPAPVDKPREEMAATQEGLRRIVEREWQAAGHPLLDWPEGEGHGTPIRRDSVVEEVGQIYGERMAAMKKAADAVGALFVVAVPVVSPDLPAQISLYDPRMDAAARAQVEQKRGKVWELLRHGQVAEASRFFEEIQEYGQVHADISYLEFQIRAAMGPADQAWVALQRAGALDLSTDHIPYQYREQARELCQGGNCLCVDVYPHIFKEAGTALWGKEFFFSPGHMSARGYELFARVVAEGLIPRLEKDLGPATPGWQSFRGLLDFDRFPSKMFMDGPGGPPPVGMVVPPHHQGANPPPPGPPGLGPPPGPPPPAPPEPQPGR